MTAPTRAAGTETPRTDALFSRHSDETNALCREGAMPSGWHGHSVRQAVELLQHARQLETELHAARAKALEEAADVCDELTFPVDIDKLLHMTKKEMAALACLKCSKAIRSLITERPAK